VYWKFLKYFFSYLPSHYQEFPYSHAPVYSLGWLRTVITINLYAVPGANNKKSTGIGNPAERPSPGVIYLTDNKTGAVLSGRISIKSFLLYLALISATFSGSGVVTLANAGDGGNNECPVGLVSGMELNDEFGAGTSDLTKCLDRRHNVKVLFQINQFCRDVVANADCTRPYALGNINNMINDYEITHGMLAGKDYEIVAVVHSGGGRLLLTNDGIDGNGAAVTGRNQFEGTVKGLISNGVKFYFCQNTARSFLGNNTLPTVAESTTGATGELIEGVQYTTAGVTAIAEFQQRSYEYVQP
jgi:intracellular sulfur oxidation DsrE/DsrF family protein